MFHIKSFKGLARQVSANLVKRMCMMSLVFTWPTQEPGLKDTSSLINLAINRDMQKTNGNHNMPIFL